jgi:hypothetical protein
VLTVSYLDSGLIRPAAESIAVKEGWYCQGDLSFSLVVTLSEQEGGFRLLAASAVDATGLTCVSR